MRGHPVKRPLCWLKGHEWIEGYYVGAFLVKVCRRCTQRGDGT